jgi:hypothetical protein
MSLCKAVFKYLQSKEELKQHGNCSYDSKIRNSLQIHPAVLELYHTCVRTLLLSELITCSTRLRTWLDLTQLCKIRLNRLYFRTSAPMLFCLLPLASFYGRSLGNKRIQFVLRIQSILMLSYSTFCEYSVLHPAYWVWGFNGGDYE